MSDDARAEVRDRDGDRWIEIVPGSDRWWCRFGVTRPLDADGPIPLAKAALDEIAEIAEGVER